MRLTKLFPDSLIEGDIISNVLTAPHERLMVAKRQHALALLGPFLSLGLVGLLAIAISYLLFSYMLGMHELSLISSLMVILLGLDLAAKCFIDWYLHLYIVTTNKLLEVKFHPLATNVISTILLDQVKCTEVDIRTDGIIHHLLDIGNVTLTFDRPTKEEAFSFQNIGQYCEVGAYLRDILVNPSDPKHVMPVWFIDPTEPHKTRFREELIPGELGGTA